MSKPIFFVLFLWRCGSYAERSWLWQCLHLLPLGHSAPRDPYQALFPAQNHFEGCVRGKWSVAESIGRHSICSWIRWRSPKLTILTTVRYTIRECALGKWSVGNGIIWNEDCCDICLWSLWKWWSYLFVLDTNVVNSIRLWATWLRFTPFFYSSHLIILSNDSLAGLPFTTAPQPCCQLSTHSILQHQVTQTNTFTLFS